MQSSLCSEDPYYMILARPGWEHVAAQFLKRTFAATPYFPTIPDLNRADAVKPTISGYLFARFPRDERLNPCGRLPTVEELKRCQDATPRFLMVFMGESERNYREEPRFYCNPDDEIINEAMKAQKRQKRYPVYEPMSLHPDIVDSLKNTLQVDSKKVLDNMVGKMVQIPFGTFMGMKAKIHRISKNKSDIRSSICQLFIKEKGIFLDAKVSFTLGELTKS